MNLSPIMGFQHFVWSALSKSKAMDYLPGYKSFYSEKVMFSGSGHNEGTRKTICMRRGMLCGSLNLPVSYDAGALYGRSLSSIEK